MKSILALLVFSISICSLADENSDKNHFGAALTLKKPMTVEQAINNASNTSSPILVEGEIGSVCQAKGCWMGFNSKAGNVRVTFKDYGFFVPFSIVGKTVQAEGTLEKVTLSLEDSKHLVKDGGGDPDSVTEPLVEYQMVASGVVIK